MIVLRGYVLVEQIATKKDTKIILDNVKDDKAKYDYEITIKQVGPDIPEDSPIKPGKEPVFTKHVQFLSTRVIEMAEDQSRSVMEFIVHKDDIIAILEEGDNIDPEEKNKQVV